MSYWQIYLHFLIIKLNNTGEIALPFLFNHTQTDA